LSNDGTKLSTHAQANYARGELATALRKGPFQVNVLLAGYDENLGGSLYHLDYMGTMHYEEALKIVEKCINEIHTRFMMSQPNFMIKNVDKDGVHVISFGADPADT
jgi:20S proteasome subunit beta 4